MSDGGGIQVWVGLECRQYLFTTEKMVHGWPNTFRAKSINNLEKRAGGKIERKGWEGKKKIHKETIKRIIVMFRRERTQAKCTFDEGGEKEIWRCVLTTLTRRVCDQAHIFASSWQI